MGVDRIARVSLIVVFPPIPGAQLVVVAVTVTMLVLSGCKEIFRALQLSYPEAVALVRVAMLVQETAAIV